MYNGRGGRAFHTTHNSVIKGVRQDRLNKGDARKWGSSVRLTEIEANREQIRILRDYINNLREARGLQRVHALKKFLIWNP